MRTRSSRPSASIGRPLVLVAGLLLPFLSAPSTAAHDAPGSTDFQLLVPDMPLFGSITFVSLIGPAAGEEVLHTSFDLTFTSPPGGTHGSDILLELTMPLVTGPAEWVVTGTDLGWPEATGTFQGTIDSDLLNGVLNMGPFGFTLPELVMLSTDGGLTGQFTASTITLELAGACQEDLGFAGPGSVELSVCGDALATGGTATLVVQGAPAGAAALLLAGLSSNPTPFKGGVLLPVPALLALPATTNAHGALVVDVAGGGGPLTVYLQAAVADAAQPAGVALSNAVKLELLP